MPLSDNSNTIAVIITSHNYGKYLAEAIESALHQTHPASEVIVVDDASEDDTKEVTLRYTQSGVRYIRGEWYSAALARNAGLEQTIAPFLVFLDADDILHQDYLRCGLDVLQSYPDTAIAYTDYQCFGDRSNYYTRPETFDWEHFHTAGDLSADSMLRRDALLQAGAWPAGKNIDADWITFRRIMSLGWHARKSRGLFFYRVHDGGQFRRLMQYSYADRAGLFDEPVSVVASNSGTQCLNAAIRRTTTPLIWLLDDSIVLPPNTLRKLVSHFETNVLSVSLSCSRGCANGKGTPCFCCTMIRGEFLRRTPLREGPPHNRIEDNFFHDTNAQKKYQMIIEPIIDQSSIPSSPSISASSHGAITVVAAADENYALGLAAMGCSLGINHKGERRIDFYILDGGITDQTKSDLLASWKYDNMYLHWITPDTSCIKNLTLTFWFTRAMYLRLLIPDLLPQSVTKAIYLDSDLLVLTDIAELWDIDLGEHPIGAVQDMKCPTFDQALQMLQELNADPKTPYFHSGVLSLNLKQWREKNLSVKIIRFIEQFREKIQWPDQDGINAILAATCLTLDPKWNVSVESFAHSWEKSVFDRETFANLTNNPAIVHFATQSKPWHSHCQHPKRNLFFEYLDRTMWKNWRPYVSQQALSPSPGVAHSVQSLT